MKLTEIKNQTVFLKCDLNLPTLKDTARIEAAIETIKLLLDQKNRVIIATHWGRPDGEIVEEFSTQKLVEVVEKCLEKSGLNEKIQFLDQFRDGFTHIKNKISGSDSKIFLLQNTRFSPDEDSKNEQRREQLAKNYASLADFMVDEAFSLSHRREVTNTDIKKFVDSVFGLNYESEVKILGALKSSAEHPFIIIMGGAKLETKLPLVEKMLEKCDKLLLAGQICFTFVEAKKQLDQSFNLDIKNSLVEKDFVDEAKTIIQKYGEKLVFPVDFKFNETGEFKDKPYAADIGEKTVGIFENEINKAKSIFWNGPMGQLELKPFDKGTAEIAKCLAKTDVKVIVGGGDTVAGLDKEILDGLYFVSTGGGATLDFLSK